MANKRDLKKDINFLTDEVIDTCFLHYHLKQNNPEEKEKIELLIEDVIRMRNDLMQRLNNPDESLKGKSLKAHYSAILQEMIKKTDETFEKLGKFSA